jgi:hypothetical protein
MVPLYPTAKTSDEELPQTPLRSFVVPLVIGLHSRLESAKACPGRRTATNNATIMMRKKFAALKRILFICSDLLSSEFVYRLSSLVSSPSTFVT